jgi:aspartyl-tRNA(Asn)/glutamyl-tRNA(Gln) amidotransferase subunit B
MILFLGQSSAHLAAPAAAATTTSAIGFEPPSVTDPIHTFGEPDVGVASVDEMAIKPNDLAEMIALIEKGVLHNNAGRQLLRAMMKTGKRAKALVEELGLAQVQDAGAIEKWCRDALVGKDAIVADVKTGKTNAINALLGPVMKASGGKANPQVVRETLLRIIEKGA